jgi:hypothetical protein
MGPESQLREDLADAMRDCATAPIGRESGELKSSKKKNVSLVSFCCGSVFLYLLF